MRCLVTGASGFVGAALSRQLRARGHDVVAMLRTTPTDADKARLGGLDAPGASFALADVGDPDAVARAATGCEVVFHCAGIASPAAAERALQWVNVAGTENVINAARAVGVRRVVHVSCADVSLIHADRIHWGEARVITQRPIDAHARTKLLAEEVALSASVGAFEVTALRPAWIWGAGDHTNLPLLCAQSQRGGVRLHGNGDNLFAVIHIDNLVHALISAATAKNAPGNAYYVADADALTAREFFTQLCQASGMSGPRAGVYAIDLAQAWLSERLAGNRGAVANVVRRGRGSLFDIQGAYRDLDFAPQVTTEAGMKTLAAWMQSVGGVSGVVALRRTAADAQSVDAQVQRAAAHVAS